MSKKPLLKITRSQQYSVTMRLLKEQGMLCLVCKEPIKVSTRGRGSDYCLDHDHESGEVRAVLHRSCNSALGKAEHAVGRWGAKSSKYADIIPYLRKMVAYYDWVAENPTGLMYPNHRSPEEKAEAAKLKRRKQYATKKAAASVKKRQQSKGNS